MLEFFVIFGIIVTSVALMSVGVMFKRKPIAGSCGGLNSVGVDKVCQCENPCDEKLKREQQKQEHIIKFDA